VVLQLQLLLRQQQQLVLQLQLTTTPLPAGFTILVSRLPAPARDAGNLFKLGFVLLALYSSF
jgi:hypothetical protein